MRIVIDMQGAQTESRLRGIGRYTLAFAQAVVRYRGEHEVILALSGLFPETIEPLRAAFDGLLPQNSIRVWQAPGPVRECEPGNQARREVAEKIYEAFLASLKPDVIHLCSLFEGFGDDAVTSIKTLTHDTPVSVTLHDLIPLLSRAHYLEPNPTYREHYLRKIDHLKRADRLIGVSASSCREAVEHLGFDSAHVLNVGEASGGNFRAVVIQPAEEKALREKLGLPRPFALYLSADDWRKNHPRLIEAWGQLPESLRQSHQLALVGINPGHQAQFEKQANKAGLEPGRDVVFIPWLPDSDINRLFNLCQVFVFPSWHEGFGLPALEAMECGKAVIASNTSSLPEVVGRDDALFDPFDVHSIAQKIEQVLSDNAFRQDLERHALTQAKKFNWDECARRAWQAWETMPYSKPEISVPTRRPRLAYVSPLPPERTGIADYSAELIPELTRWYDIDLIVAQPDVSDAYLKANCAICTVEEFRANAHGYDRVLYHFGNSPFHAHMCTLLDEIPGVVVLHDFFLSNIPWFRDAHGRVPHAWPQALYTSHGYRAVLQRYAASDKNEVVMRMRYPANLPVLQGALGVVVHSESSRQLARQWYGDGAAHDWALIPHLRTPSQVANREAARQALGLGEDDMVVCSFGLLDPTKLNHRLLAAWLQSPLAQDSKAHLVFVGENHGGDYGQELSRHMKLSGAGRIRITGWADTETFRQYLAAADIGVQLRTHSRGETSGTVLDCMNYGLATIVNAHGSMADLDPQGVWMLPDAFTDEELSKALTTLAQNAERRRVLGQRAQAIIRTHHAPHRCAEQYAQAIEAFHQSAQNGVPGLLPALARQPLPESEWPRVAAKLAQNFAPVIRRRQLLVDCSTLVQTDLKTGIERVVRAILREWLDNPPHGFQVEPVYATADAPGYRYARRWTSHFLGIPEDWAEDAPAEAWAGDVFIGLDLQPHRVPAQQAFLQQWRACGVCVCFVIYDLLPVMLPQVFPEGAQAGHQRWLETISQFDGVVGISRAVADEMAEWLATFGPRRERPLAIGWFHLGADIQNSSPTAGLPPDAAQVLDQLRSRPSFLMVGTVEPRKGYLQTLTAFEALWRSGADVNLVIVGQEGWKPLADAARRDIPETVARLRTHPELSKRLFWLEGISDEYLEKVYASSTCLIAASYGEGFGLPLIEAAQHKLPILARDIAVFREVCGEHASYFPDSRDPETIAQGVQQWLKLHKEGRAPRSAAMPWLTWKQSAAQLFEILNGKAEPYRRWLPDDTIRYWGGDLRLHTEVGERTGRSMQTTGRSGFLIYGPYRSLPAGRYRLALHGTAKHWTGHEWVDVTCDQGERHLMKVALSNMDEGEWRFEHEFLVESSVEDLAIRLSVNSTSDFVLRGIDAEKNQSANNDAWRGTDDTRNPYVFKQTKTLDNIKLFVKSKINSLQSSSNDTTPIDDVIIIQTADDNKYINILKAASSYNRAYCNKYKIKLHIETGILIGCFAHHAMFNRIKILSDFVDNGYRGWVLYVDADAIIKDKSFDLREKLRELRALNYFSWLHNVYLPSNKDQYHFSFINDGVFALDLSSKFSRIIIKTWISIYSEFYDETDFASANSWDDVINDNGSINLIISCMFDAFGNEFLDKICFEQFQDCWNGSEFKEGIFFQSLRPNAGQESSTDELGRRIEKIHEKGMRIYGDIRKH